MTSAARIWSLTVLLLPLVVVVEALGQEVEGLPRNLKVSLGDSGDIVDFVLVDPGRCVLGGPPRKGWIGPVAGIGIGMLILGSSIIGIRRVKRAFQFSLIHCIVWMFGVGFVVWGAMLAIRIYKDEMLRQKVGETRDSFCYSNDKCFYISRYEITVGQMKALTPDRLYPSYEFNSYPVNRRACPAWKVTCEDAIAFCEELSKTSGYRVRLPTENEWEFACVMGFGERPWTEWNAFPIIDFAWYADNSGGYPHPVGTKLPDKNGVFDMLGNVSEICTLDNTDTECGHDRIVLKGQWYRSPSSYCLPFSRTIESGKERGSGVGFRPVLEVRAGQTVTSEAAHP